MKTLKLYSIYYEEFGDQKCELVVADHEPSTTEAVEFLKMITDTSDSLQPSDIWGVYESVAYTLDGKDTTITAVEVEK